MNTYKKEGKIKGELVIEGNLTLTGNLIVEKWIDVKGSIDCECNGSMTSNTIYATTHRIITEDRLALLTELRDSVLLEERTVKEIYPEANTEVADHKLACQVFGKECNNALARKIKAHLDELIKSTSI